MDRKTELELKKAKLEQMRKEKAQKMMVSRFDLSRAIFDWKTYERVRYLSRALDRPEVRVCLAALGLVTKL